MGSVVVRSLVISVVAFLAACGSGSGSESVSSPPTQLAHPYTTTFPLTENPISEHKVWINGGVTGLNWTNVRTTPGLAFGTETGSAGFDDSIAILTGTWGPDQTVMATVHSVNQQTGNIFEEVELLLRFEITAHLARGYEVNFRCTHDGTQYTQVVRWEGPLGSFSYITSLAGPGISNGDTVKATIVGSLITVYINNVAIFSVNDTKWKDGNPGMAFFLRGPAGLNSDYGFTSYTASDAP
jgi:hypothetical protein